MCIGIRPIIQFPPVMITLSTQPIEVTQQNKNDMHSFTLCESN